MYLSHAPRMLKHSGYPLHVPLSLHFSTCTLSFHFPTCTLTTGPCIFHP